MSETIRVTTTPATVLRHAVELAEKRDGEDLWEMQARTLDELGYRIVPHREAGELRERVAAALHIGLDDATPNDPECGEEGHRRWVARVQEWAEWVHEQYAPHLASDAPTLPVELDPQGGQS